MLKAYDPALRPYAPLIVICLNRCGLCKEGCTDEELELKEWPDGVRRLRSVTGLTGDSSFMEWADEGERVAFRSGALSCRS